jgi:hypothetical protein
MDERIRNLMHERGHEDLLLNVDDPELEEKTMVVMDRLQRASQYGRDRQDRGQKLEGDGSYGGLLRGTCSEAVSGIPDTQRGALMGRLSAAAEPEPEQACRDLWMKEG